MRTIVKNILLTFILTGIFAIPFLSFSIIEEVDSSDLNNQSLPEVLGDRSEFLFKKRDIKKVPQEDIFKVLYQEDILLNLGRDKQQFIYNVLRREYLDSEEYYVLLVYPEIHKSFFDITLERTDDAFDIKIDLLDDDPLSYEVPVSLMVFAAL